MTDDKFTYIVGTFLVILGFGWLAACRIAKEEQEREDDDRI